MRVNPQACKVIPRDDWRRRICDPLDGYEFVRLECHGSLGILLDDISPVDEKSVFREETTFFVVTYVSGETSPGWSRAGRKDPVLLELGNSCVGGPRIACHPYDAGNLVPADEAFDPFRKGGTLVKECLLASPKDAISGIRQDPWRQHLLLEDPSPAVEWEWLERI